MPSTTLRSAKDWTEFYKHNGLLMVWVFEVLKSQGQEYVVVTLDHGNHVFVFEGNCAGLTRRDDLKAQRYGLDEGDRNIPLRMEDAKDYSGFRFDIVADEPDTKYDWSDAQDKPVMLRLVDPAKCTVNLVTSRTLSVSVRS